MSRRINASTQNNKKIQRTSLAQITMHPRAKEVKNSDHQRHVYPVHKMVEVERDLVQSPVQAVATPAYSVGYS